ITVGADRPVYSCILESFSATSTWIRSKGILRIPSSLGRIILILLDVDTNSGTDRTSSRETEYLSGTISEEVADTLMLGDRAINRILILELISSNHIRNI
uniref:Uncharacterized protein n=1 Tax=Oryza brachyantha TaxID=4533 RepID=J3LS56_ORYBR